MIEAIRSTLEWAASVTIAIEPVIAPAASLSTIRTMLEAIETAAARALRGDSADGPAAWTGAATVSGDPLTAAASDPREQRRVAPAAVAPGRPRGACPAA